MNPFPRILNHNLTLNLNLPRPDEGIKIKSKIMIKKEGAA